MKSNIADSRAPVNRQQARRRRQTQTRPHTFTLTHQAHTQLATAKRACSSNSSDTRKTFSHSTQSAKNKIAREELLTKEFFTTFKSRTNNGDIAELYTTASWDNPIHDQDNTTDSDKGILKELRKYYSWLYGEKPSLENEAPLKTLRDRPLQESDIKLMERPVTLYECRQAIHRLGLAKSAGPDGLPAEFYKSVEELVVRDLHNCRSSSESAGGSKAL
eukprot:scaffold4369_cov149-Isochrysis_galbana.AAC.1